MFNRWAESVWGKTFSAPYVHIVFGARQTGKSHYQLLEDMFLGFRLPAHSGSPRKNLLSTDRFLFFDLGIRHAAAGLRPNADVVLANPGHELVVANYVVHFDHWWNPAVMNQATARAHRPGQTKTVFAYDLWVEDT